MGYDLHVTRGDSKPIAETEWRPMWRAIPSWT